jgi:hypothetical protein
MSKTKSSEAGHPSNHGYVRCQRCKTWIPGSRVVNAVAVAVSAPPYTLGSGSCCHDTKWCGEQVGLGKGAIDPEAL